MARSVKHTAPARPTSSTGRPGKVDGSTKDRRQSADRVPQPSTGLGHAFTGAPGLGSPIYEAMVAELGDPIA